MKVNEELSMRAKAFVLLQEEKINPILDNYRKNDPEHQEYAQLITKLLAENRITYEEYEIIERETISEFCAFVDNLDQIQEIRIVF